MYTSSPVLAGTRGRGMAVRHAVLAAALLLVAVRAFSGPAIPQDPAYSTFADARPYFGVPNALDVLSNLAFLVVAVLGLRLLGQNGGATFADGWERRPWAALFVGVLLTTFGSSYFHLAPDNWRLVWDRLPMTVGFMGLLTAVVAERIGVRAARRALYPLLLAGLLSVVYWYWTELRGVGDLRPYLLVQFGSLLSVVLLLALYPARYTGSAWMIAGLGAYVLAKVVEVRDAQILSAAGVSGHTLKHLLAAAGVWCLVVMLRRRRVIGGSPVGSGESP
jgi:hypothetical protein